MGERDFLSLREVGSSQNSQSLAGYGCPLVLSGFLYFTLFLIRLIWSIFGATCVNEEVTYIYVIVVMDVISIRILILLDTLGTCARSFGMVEAPTKLFRRFSHGLQHNHDDIIPKLLIIIHISIRPGCVPVEVSSCTISACHSLNELRASW